MNKEHLKKIIILAAVILVLTQILFFALKLKKSHASDEEKYIAVNQTKISDSAPIASILFVGDMMFDRYVRQTSQKNGADFAFEKMKSIFKDQDLIVGNLEGPITEKASVSVNTKMGERNNYVFTFDPQVAQVLANENIKLVNIGNNHIENFGSDGVESTRNFLKKEGVNFFGDPEKSENRLFVQKLGEFTIAFVNYNQFVQNAEQKTLEDLQKAKGMNPDVIVVFTHWGTEFSTSVNENQKRLAHAFVDNGADLIIGTHPHVVEPMEEYNGKRIYYSLGNFIFDQYFDPNTQNGLIIRVQIDASKQLHFQEQSVQIKGNGQTVLAQ